MEEKPRKKMGRPTDNPRTEKLNLRLSEAEAEEITKCAEAMGVHRVEAILAGIRLLEEKLGI